jgi:hypothetical protein
MIHVVEGDPRVPSPQSVELHMGLKRVGVPTELFMYPGASHGIPDARNRLVKSTAEMAWMNYWVLGNGTKFSWREVLETLEDPKAEKKVEVKGLNRTSMDALANPSVSISSEWVADAATEVSALLTLLEAAT